MPVMEVDTEVLDTWARRVARGVKFLDENVPTWLDKINLEEMNLQSGDNCILGQLAAKSALQSAGYELDGYRGYDSAEAALRNTHGDFAPALYGFISDGGETGEEEEAYWALNHLWTVAILLRSAGVKVNKRVMRAVARQM